MNKKQIILIGGGGHCKSCIDIIEKLDLYEIFGIIDMPEKIGQQTLGYKVIGNDDEIGDFAAKGFRFLVTMGQIKSPKARIRLFDQLKNVGAQIETISSNRSYVSKSATLGEGTIVMHDALVNSAARIGNNCIINTKALIEHDAEIGSNTHVSTNVLINGESKIGANCFVGSGAVISSQIEICDNVVIGAGSVVTKNIQEAGTYVGNPAKKIR